MAETKVNLGMLPVNRGEYSSSAKYYKDNIVQYNGSSYVCTVPIGADIDNPAYSQGTAPYTSDPTQLNTGWATFASGNNTFTTGQNVNSIGVDTEPTSGSPNLVESGGVASVNGYYKENSEYVRVYLDNDGNILWGIQKNGNVLFGAGVPEQIKSYILDKISELNLEKVNDIVTFLDGLEEGYVTLRTMINGKVDKIVGKSLIDTGYASSMSSVDNAEWLDVKLDGDGNIIEGVKSDGSKYIGIDVNINGTSIKTTETHEYLEAKTDKEGKIIMAVKKDGTVYIPKIGNSDIERLSKESVIRNYIIPENVFGVWNVLGIGSTASKKEYTREYLNIIYPDRFYEKAKALFDGAAAYKTLSNSTRFRVDVSDDVIQETVPVSIGGDGYKTVSGNLKLITTKNSVAIGENVTLMSIGDSITQGSDDFWDKTGNWAYEVFTDELFQMDDIDNVEDNGGTSGDIQCHLIGSRKLFNRSVTYRGVTIDHSNDCCEGRGGWAIADYLRFPIRAGASKGVYDILGLRTIYGSPDDISTERMGNLIGNTCWGKNEPDITEYSWNAFRSRIGAGSVSWANATQAQKEALATWTTDTITANPENPFYDKSAYNSDYNTMFSWDAYYSRKKTVENDGVTPLSEKGTSYTQGTAVCVPRFISICLGVNDTVYSRTQEEVATDIINMASILRTETNANILVLNAGYPASQIPEYHPNISLQIDYQINNKIADAHKRNMLVIERLGDLSTQQTDGIYYCPTFFVQGFDTSRTHRTECLGTETDYNYSWCSNDVHPGPCAHKQIGYQLYSIINYILSL